MRPSVLAALLISAVPALAQNCKYVPDSIPSGPCNVIPFGTTKNDATWGNQRYQTILTTAQLGNVPGMICELGFVPCGTGPRSFDSIEIQMAQTQLADFTTSNNFLTNLGASPTTVLSAKNYVWHNTASTWNRIGLQSSFLYIPARGNVLIDIVIMGSGFTGSAGFNRSDTTVPPDRLYATSWTGTPPATGSTDKAGLKVEVCFDIATLDRFGLSCAGSAGTPSHTYSGSCKLASTVNIDLSGVLASRPQVLLVGFSNLPLPIDLTLGGAPGCNLYVTPDLPIVRVSNTGGTATLPLAIPNDSGLVCGRLYTQWVSIDAAANKMGVALSNYGRILIGTGP